MYSPTKSPSFLMELRVYDDPLVDTNMYNLSIVHGDKHAFHRVLTGKEGRAKLFNRRMKTCLLVCVESERHWHRKRLRPRRKPDQRPPGVAPATRPLPTGLAPGRRASCSRRQEGEDTTRRYGTTNSESAILLDLDRPCRFS